MSKTTFEIVESRPPTRLEYLDSPYSYEKSATVVSVDSLDDGMIAVVPNATIFYPRGGGQPSDEGRIESTQSVFVVKEVHLQEGFALHMGTFEKGDSFREGENILLFVDREKRELHSRLHTAGELICAVMRDMGYGGELVDGAIHYPDRTSVTYKHSFSPEERQALQDHLETKANRLIRDGGFVEICSTQDREEIRRRCGYDPAYIPAGTSVRIVTVAGEIGRPCQGTHVRNISEIGPMKIRKVKCKKGKTTISYTLV